MTKKELIREFKQTLDRLDVLIKGLETRQDTGIVVRQFDRRTIEHICEKELVERDGAMVTEGDDTKVGEAWEMKIEVYE